MCITDVGCGAAQLSSWVAEFGIDRGEGVGVARQCVGQHAAVADARRVAAVGIDDHVGSDVVDDRIDESDVVDVLTPGLSTTAAHVPGPATPSG
jgi:hypothetical protein